MGSILVSTKVPSTTAKRQGSIITPRRCMQGLRQIVHYLRRIFFKITMRTLRERRLEEKVHRIYGGDRFIKLRGRPLDGEYSSKSREQSKLWEMAVDGGTMSWYVGGGTMGKDSSLSSFYRSP
ncbi:hypothetical protein BaRGS_00019530 [Batillaria attramentaria]|uniref:Uncharacterized protein n=1 Tax=Batillaria attramentaria TaxID=370345 RepID=A0ABD0KPT7_9CAEN